MKRNEYGLESQPTPPKPPAQYPVGGKAVALIGRRAFSTGTVKRVECVPAGAFITIDYGRGAVATYRPRNLEPVPE